MTIYSSGQTISSLTQAWCITLGADELIYEVAGRASDKGLDGTGELGDRTSEGHTSGVYGKGLL